MPQNNRKYFRKGKKKRITQPVATGKIEDAILETLSYRHIFNYPLTFYQLNTSLLTKRRTSQKIIRRSLKKLVQEKKVIKTYGNYSLTDTKLISWKERFDNSRELLGKAEKAAKILAKIPWILLVGVTGSVAAFNAAKNDDIDLFIISKTHRLWLTRGFVFVILKILGELRTDETPNQKICPNIFVDDKSLAWSRKGRNLYVAHEILMLHPLFDREQVYFKFIKENDWVFKFFGNQQEPQYELKPVKQKNNRIVNIFEKLAYRSQLAYMKDKKTTEITTQGVIHFNKFDNTERILSGFEEAKSKNLNVE